MFILDEFDRVADVGTKAAMADLIKNVSDNNPNVTLVLVGVGSSIAELIGEHESVQRNLVQVELPPMSADEIKSIITKGCRELGIAVDDDVLTEVATLAGGFPHYAHLLGLSLAKACISRDTTTVDSGLFEGLVCSMAVEDAIESYRQAFSQATRTIQLSRYPQILCACAYAEHDDRGIFRATDVAEAFSYLFGENLAVQSVVPALGEFSSEGRGPVLQKIKHGNRSHYRFCEPMMRPFLRIKAKSMTAQ